MSSSGYKSVNNRFYIFPNEETINEPFFQPSDRLVEAISRKIEELRAENIEEVEISAENSEEEIKYLQEIEILQAGEQNLINESKKISESPLAKYLSKEIYYYLGFLSRHLPAKSEPLPAKDVIIEEMPTILGLRKEDPLVHLLAHEFARWINGKNYKTGWGMIIGKTDGNMYLINESSSIMERKEDKIPFEASVG